jgi:hypothetical protein
VQVLAAGRRQVLGVQEGKQRADRGRPRRSAARHLFQSGLVQPDAMLDRVDTCGHELARARDRRVHRHPGAGFVHGGGKLRNGADRVGGLGAGPGGQVGEVSDHLDPPRAPADLGQRTADQVGLVHRRAEQVGEVAARGSQEPARRLQRWQPCPELISSVTPPGDPTSRTTVTPACAQAIRFARAASSSSGTYPAGPAATAGCACASTRPGSTYRPGSTSAPVMGRS